MTEKQKKRDTDLRCRKMRSRRRKELKQRKMTAKVKMKTKNKTCWNRKGTRFETRWLMHTMTDGKCFTIKARGIWCIFNILTNVLLQFHSDLESQNHHIRDCNYCNFRCYHSKRVVWSDHTVYVLILIIYLGIMKDGSLLINASVCIYHV